MDDKGGLGSGPSSQGGVEEKLSKEVLEKRRFERLRTNLRIKYSVMGPAEEATLPKGEYVAPGAFKANTVEMSDFKKLTNEELVVSENISHEGVKISLAHPVVEGARLWLQVGIPGAPMPLNALGEVRWCRATGTSWSAGIKFIGISHVDMEKVDAFLVSQKAEQGPSTEKTAQSAAEKRGYERLQASLDIKYRVVAPDEEAALKKNDYVVPGAFKASTSEVGAFNALANKEVVVSEDISLGGLKISVSNPVAEGMRLRLEVSIPDVPIPVNAVGEVRWCRASGNFWNAGVMFTGISKSDLEKVDRFLVLQKRAQMSKRA